MASLSDCCVQSTSNYVARRYGVRAAMPGFIGQKLCPELIIIPPNFDKYSAKSEQVRAVFAEYDPNYSTMSLDEAYLDITEHLETRRFSTEDERTFPGYSHPELICRCRSNSGMYINCCWFLVFYGFRFFIFGWFHFGFRKMTIVTASVLVYMPLLVGQSKRQETCCSCHCRELSYVLYTRLICLNVVFEHLQPTDLKSKQWTCSITSLQVLTREW